jgi:uncharacterized protein YabE (DUF348 family)
LILLTTLWWGYMLAGRPVTLVINGQSRQIRTHYQTVEAIIRDLGLTLEAEDIIHPATNTLLSPNDTLTIQLARPVTIQADNQTWQFLTQQPKIAGILVEIGLVLNPRDQLLINGKVVSVQSPLPVIEPGPPRESTHPLLLATTPRGTLASSRPNTVEVVVRRAMSITLFDEETVNTFQTTRPNVAEVLRERGITLFAKDKVIPGLDTLLSPKMEIHIDRAIPVTILANGRALETRTHAETVAQMLAEEGLALVGQDFSRPPADHPISSNDTIKIVRVHESLEIGQEIILFETQWIPDEDMQLDQQEVRQTGEHGVLKTRTRIRYENGQEVGRKLEDEWLDQEPSNRVIAYGTDIVIRSLETADGPIEYWRRIPMLTTAYSAATSGKPPDHPEYGMTRAGMRAGRGIVAVDPRVVPLLTNVYVPGYGHAVAGDTGGGVLGKHIDLGYNDDETVPLMYEWRDVYILTPVPSTEKIRYVLPQWPQQR